MKSITSVALALLAFATYSFAAPQDTVFPKKVGEVVPGKYIITVKEGVTGEGLESFVSSIESSLLKEDGSSPIQNVFNIADSFKGFSGDFSEQDIEQIKADSRVARVSPSRYVAISAIQDGVDSWGLARVGENKKTVKDFTKYSYPDSAGSGVTAYVVDTGCVPSHEELEGRATLGKAFGSKDSTDGHGHGTHVAGTIAGKTYGVAKKAKIVCVKVLDDQGSGTDADVIAGIDWVAKDAKDKKAVANMSLGGEATKELDDAVDAAVKSGVTFVVAAGNDSQDACEYSPARASSAVCVAASTKEDTHAFFSNTGKCVTLYAPGHKIKSSWLDGEYKTISGTSMASPHVCGVAALYLAEDNSLTPAQLKEALVKKGTKDVISDAPKGTANLIAYAMYK